MLLKLSTARNRPILMVDSVDHVTGKTGLTLTITASKDGAAFASITPTVTKLSNGWYNVALTTTHTNTLGAFVLHVSSAGADPTDVLDEIVSLLPSDVPTAIENADALLKRDMSAVTGESARSPLNALRWLRNKWTIVTGTLTVYKED